MYIKIPFTSNIDFKTNISEITKMSLEHDFNVNDDVVLGNFYVSGEYRAHEVSVNTDEFKYTLPFEVNISESIKKDTLEFNIEDFSYEIIDNKTLKVNIEYSLSAEKNDLDVFEKVDENELSNEIDLIDNFLDSQKNRESEGINEEDRELKEEMERNDKEDSKEKIMDDDTKTIMNTIKDSDDTFVTYHIHIVKESETLESICALYNVSNSLINEYNENISINPGDKILIPKLDE
jgi:LysM repeat protein